MGPPLSNSGSNCEVHLPNSVSKSRCLFGVPLRAAMPDALVADSPQRPQRQPLSEEEKKKRNRSYERNRKNKKRSRTISVIEEQVRELKEQISELKEQAAATLVLFELV